ncbi:hypothetical protein CYMTET_7140 [Cymbomonas tetramitiformis]|uniref:Uncharacterized protein n=1 Tax=Cymbomonas tetramitiformis TaxID=36881 RepID=A0AAE0LHA6_9CHLO|nr:hypothetical protein CYMTET_7140 [Cymbomonas tetramitiformis]|eukprot:gene19449-23255_t
MAEVFVVIVVQTILLLFLQFGKTLLPSNFVARKACHAGSGLLMLLLNSRDVVARFFVYSVVFVSLGMTWKWFPSWVPVFRFGGLYDSGITIYLVIVCFWFYCQQPSVALAPLFFADPAGAIFGKLFSNQGINKVWWENKTVVGTLAVFFVAFLALDIPVFAPRLCVASLCALGEAFGGRTYDNAVIAIPALGSWLWFHGWATGAETTSSIAEMLGI